LKEMIRTVSLFQNLNDEQLDKVWAICKKVKYGPNTVLFREKEAGGAFYIVVSGSVKIYTSHGGSQKILATFQPGDSFGEMSLIDGKPRSATAETLEESTLLSIEARDFLHLLQEQFDITLEIMRDLVQRLRDTNEHVQDLTFLDARTRVVKRLLMLANRNGRREGSVIHVRNALNYDELSRLAGVQHQVLIETVRDLETKGLLRFVPDGYRIDLTKLKR
jgi:cAMP-binding proteins - catabolite gene activator and regulatory subunit of cAMP-dependent protein kinases